MNENNRTAQLKSKDEKNSRTKEEKMKWKIMKRNTQKTAKGKEKGESEFNSESKIGTKKSN